MFDAELTSVLPPHSTDFERALEQASLWVIQNSEIVDVWNPETCPLPFLPWLAWSVSVDDWDSNWSDETKRKVIRTSIDIHRLKGTIGAVKATLSSRGYGAEISEWFQYNGAPHTFRLNVLIEGQISFDFSHRAKILRAIDAVKPMRSHYDMTFTVKVEQQTRVGAHSSIGGVVRTLALKPTDQKERSRTTLAAISRRGGVHHTKGLAA